VPDRLQGWDEDLSSAAHRVIYDAHELLDSLFERAMISITDSEKTRSACCVSEITQHRHPSVPNRRKMTDSVSRSRTTSWMVADPSITSFCPNGLHASATSTGFAYGTPLIA
jgi:hypothetical protein